MSMGSVIWWPITSEIALANLDVKCIFLLLISALAIGPSCPFSFIGLRL